MSAPTSKVFEVDKFSPEKISSNNYVVYFRQVLKNLCLLWTVEFVYHLLLDVQLEYWESQAFLDYYVIFLHMDCLRYCF